ncbi:ATP-grasp domain-containing protein [Kaarinaea lacus]
MTHTQGRPRLLLVAPPESYRIAAYLRAANSLKVDLQIASRGEHSLVSAIASGIHIDLENEQQALDKILAIAQQKAFAGIVAPDDYTVELGAKIAARLGLPHNSPEAVKTARRKDLARQILKKNGVPVPEHTTINLNDDIKSQIKGLPLPYPCVVKPVSLSGSRGVIRVDNQSQLITACQRISKIVAHLNNVEEKMTLLVEQYIPGIEVAVEGFLQNGQFKLLTLFDKPDPLEGPYFEETYYITPSRLSAASQRLVTNRVAQACQAYGLTTGPVHAELRLWQDEAWILEVAARTIGGECARLLKFGTGLDIEQLVIANAIGESVAINAFEGAAGVLMIPTPKAGILRRVEGVLNAQKNPFNRFRYHCGTRRP